MAPPLDRKARAPDECLPPISVVINTDGRARSLELTLSSLRYLEYPNFEVCVVHGPTPDGTVELLDGQRGRIKVAACPAQNLAMSRNIGIALAAGDIVAFIDDDAIPEPEWLDDIARGYQAADVGASGGFVYNHTGTEFQWRFGTIDRLARPDLSWTRPAHEFSFPFSHNVPHLLGTNSSLRREAAIAIGGFDEEFDYFLDETDVLCRLNDAGWKISQLPNAFVHHKYQASHLRTEARVIRAWYSIIKNKIYFSILNARGHHTLQEAIEEALAYIDGHRQTMDWAISAGLLSDHDRIRFASDIERAWRDGLRRGLSGQRRLMAPELLTSLAAPFIRFETLLPSSRRRTIVFLTQDYPPEPIGGIARYVHQLARATAARGHHVHVLTRGRTGSLVDFDDGVWVHRIEARPYLAAGDLPVPQHIWDHSATMLSEAKRIASRRQVDAVVAPIWDCEGIAFLLDGQFTLITSLATTLSIWLDSHPHRKADLPFMASFAEPMLAAERLLFQRSARILALTSAIVQEIEVNYDMRFENSQVVLFPLGVEDWTKLDSILPDPLPADAVRILFVGRLEERKGIDVLFNALKQCLTDYPSAHVDLVGNDTLIGKDDKTYRELFESDRAADPFRARVHFHGEVSDAALRGFYRACDIFVAPSRFESFGLILIEAMMFAKPVIGCLAGGMVEVVEHGKSGLLAEPGDAASLAALLRRLLDDAGLRRQLGVAGRHRYETLFTPEQMADRLLACVADLCSR